MKQILLINDVVGYSHVGMVAMLPVLTRMGHSVFNLPTALVSNTLDYGQFNIMETTAYMRDTLPVWDRLGFRFDAVCTGLMFSREQAQVVADYCRRLSDGGCRVFVDPIMGDGGHLYNGIDGGQVGLMREMLSVADLAMPNYTEACLLADLPFSEEGMTRDESHRLVDALIGLGTKNVVVTSARVDGKTCVVGGGDERFCIGYEELPFAFHGTGDIFSAVLTGHLLNGATLEESTHKAVTVVSELIYRNREQEDMCLGIPVEKCLDLL